jgi:hypothetical protein
MKLLLNVGQTWPEVEHIYSVGYRGQAVGRIWFAADRQTDARPWEWHLSLPLSLPDDSKGIARSRADAMQALANSLHRLIVQTPHDRLERAFQFSAAAGLDFDRGDDVELTVEGPVRPPDQPDLVLAQGRATSGPVQRAAQTHATVAAQSPAVKQPTVQKKKPVLRVQVARPAMQVVAPQAAVVTTAAKPPGIPSPNK